MPDYHKLKGFEEGNYKGAVIRPEFTEAFKSDNQKFKELMDVSEKGIVRDIMFRGNILELKIEVNGVMLTTHRSLERRPVEIGEEMNVIVYRVYAIDDERAYLLENEKLKERDVDNVHLESYIYSSEGYFVV